MEPDFILMKPFKKILILNKNLNNTLIKLSFLQTYYKFIKKVVFGIYNFINKIHIFNYFEISKICIFYKITYIIPKINES